MCCYGHRVGCPCCCRTTDICVMGWRRQLSCTVILPAPCHTATCFSKDLMGSGHPSALPREPVQVHNCWSKPFLPTPSHQPSLGPFMSSQQECSSWHHFHLDIKTPESLFKATVLWVLWAPRNSGGGYDASWEFTLCMGKPCVVFKDTGMGGMARQTQHPSLSVWVWKQPVEPGAACGTQITMVLLEKAASS